MSAHAPVCELLGIELPIVAAPWRHVAVPWKRWRPRSSQHRLETPPQVGYHTQPVEVPDGRSPTAPRGDCADPLHRLTRCRALSALLHRSIRRKSRLLDGKPSGEPTNVALSNSFIVISVGGGPTDDKPSVTLETPRDPDRVSSFLNIRVKDIAAVYAEWTARGANFLTPPKQHQYEIRCYIRDPDGHLIEVGQTTDPDGDWTPAHWPSGTPDEESE
jgi:Glyoxalase/Bleomycin resistance protein/Dioxygenase superfamily